MWLVIVFYYVFSIYTDWKYIIIIIIIQKPREILRSGNDGEVIDLVFGDRSGDCLKLAWNPYCIFPRDSSGHMARVADRLKMICRLQTSNIRPILCKNEQGVSEKNGNNDFNNYPFSKKFLGPI